MASGFNSFPDGAPVGDQPTSPSQLIFGKYEIIRRLALGGMGEVFLARQTGVAVDRLVILKSLLPELAEQEGFVEQFLDEARVAATLNHPNIVGIYEVGSWNNVYFIAMEFIHGGDLARLQRTAAKRKLSCPYQVSARMIHDAAAGLDHAHHALSMDGKPLNIVHRDISPQNIMVRGDGVTKVVDFGIAKAANRSTRTATGMLKGKLQYMAPEQVAGGEIDGRADQFALGVVLWELTTNKRLFKADNELKTIERILKEPIPTPSSIVPGFPADLEAVIMRMLAKDPSSRYARCADAAKDLQAYLDACTRSVGPTQVAEFVRNVLGEQLDEVTANLQPTRENFLIALDGASGPRTPVPGPGVTPTTLTRSVDFRKKRALGLAAGVGLATLLLGVGAFVALMPEEQMAFGAPPAPVAPEELPASKGQASQEDEEKVLEAKKKLASAVPKARRVVKRGGDKKPTVINEILINEPQGAKVYVDGELWAELVPTVITGLSAGQHKIALELNGVREVKEVAVKEVTVAGPPPEATVKGRSVRVRGWKGAKVLLDGVPHKDRAPLTLKDLEPGRHNITLILKGEDVVFPVEIASDTRFRLTSSPSSATVMIMGKIVGVTPLNLAETVAAGVPVDVIVSKRGYETEAFEVTLEAGREGGRSVSLKKKEERPVKRPAPPPPREAEGPGYFTVRTTPWAKIAIDGEPKGSTPLFKVKLPAGQHTVKLVNEGEGVSVTKTITIQADKVLKMNWDLK